MSSTLPSQARAVVVGGGIVGVSVAYHLARRGWTDTVLLEREQLTSGTTWHAAGLLTKLRATYNMTMLAAYAEELFAEVERETGDGTGFRRTGSCRCPGSWAPGFRGFRVTQTGSSGRANAAASAASRASTRRATPSRSRSSRAASRRRWRMRSPRRSRRGLGRS